jgi:hypothetical protein
MARGYSLRSRSADAATLTSLAAPSAARTLQQTPESTHVQIAAVPNDSGVVYAVEDQIPNSWQVSNISHQGEFDTSSRRVKWGPFYDTESRVFSYQLMPAQNGTAAVSLIGTASFDGLGLAIGGTQQIQPQTRVITASVAANGVFQLEFDASSHDFYRVEVSEDLQTWTELAVIKKSDTGVAAVTDPDGAQFKQRFYRVISH